MSLPWPAGLRRILLLVAIWLAGTVLATATVYEAVTVVAGQVTAQRSAGPPPSAQDQASRRSGSSPSSSTAPSPTPATAPSPSPTPPATSPVPTANPVATPLPVARTFGLVGGTAEVSCRGNVASLDWATPNSGFAVETGSSDSGTQVEVRFRSDTHESRLEAWCSGGQVQGSIREEAT